MLPAGRRAGKIVTAWGLSTGDLKQSCRVCRDSAEARRLWGCEGPAKRPVYSIDCPACSGRDCPSCDGRGFVEYYECPNRVADAGAHEAIELFFLMKNGILPAAGGWYDQTIGFCAAMRFLSRLDAERERREFERAKRSSSGRGRR